MTFMVWEKSPSHSPVATEGRSNISEKLPRLSYTSSPRLSILSSRNSIFRSFLWSVSPLHCHQQSKSSTDLQTTKLGIFPPHPRPSKPRKRQNERHRNRHRLEIKPILLSSDILLHTLCTSRYSHRLVCQTIPSWQCHSRSHVHLGSYGNWSCVFQGLSRLSNLQNFYWPCRSWLQTLCYLLFCYLLYEEGGGATTGVLGNYWLHCCE